MYTLNSYNISTVHWNPVGFDVIGDQFDLRKIPILFNNGMEFNLYSFLKDINDYSFNNKSGIFLTNLSNNNNILLNKKAPSISSELKKIKTVISDIEYSVYKHYKIDNNQYGLQTSDNSFVIQDEIIFNFEDSYVYVEDYYGRILTNGGYGDGLIRFILRDEVLTDYHKWDYIINDNVIILFAYNTNYGSILTKNNLEHLELINVDSNLPISTNSFLFLKSYNQKEKNYNTVIDSFTVKYNANPTLNENALETIKFNEYNQSYLGIFPYKYLKENNSYDFYFHGLKNYQSTEYNYGNTNRVYYKIYSGSNQEKGLNKIYLNYQTDTISLKFKTNQLTDFYISPTSESILLSNSGLIESGASAGNHPYNSDRIFSNQFNNFSEIEELKNANNPPYNTDNKFLCSWLYGSKNSGEKKWYDRYYNSAYYTLDQALSTTFMLYNDKLNVKLNVVYDVPSEVELKYGFLYQYYHVGNNDSLKYLEDLNYKYENGEIKNSNVLNVTSWNSINLNDESFYKNYGLTFGNSANFYESYWYLDGTNYAIFQSNDILLDKNNFTASIWLKFEDWTNVNAYQIFGNYYNSGFGLINESKSIAALLTIINNGSNTIYNLNYQLTEASSIKNIFSIVQEISSDGCSTCLCKDIDNSENNEIKYSNFNIVQRMSDMSYWIFDTKNPYGIKYNINNSIVSVNSQKIKGAIKFSLSQIDQVEMDSKENLYIYDNNSKTYIIIDKNGNYLSTGTGSVDRSCNRIEISLTNENIIQAYGNCSVIDNDDNLWQVIGPNLYKNKDIVGTVGISNQLLCDIYNNIWILTDDNSYIKIDKNGNFIFKYSFKKVPLISETNCPPSTSPKPLSIKVLDEELPFLSTTDRRYILTFPDYYQILVKPPEEKIKIPKIPEKKLTRVANFINIPVLNINDENLTGVCGLSSIEYDQMVLVDPNDNQAYIINQLGQLVLKVNLENFIAKGDVVKFATGGDFTGYQYIRKFKNTKNTIFSWKFQTTEENVLSYDVSELSQGWHHFCFTFNSTNKEAFYYIDSVLVDFKKLIKGNIFYNYKTSLIIGATTIKNTLLNNFLNVNDGYKMVGSVGDLKIYNIPLVQSDIEHLYYSSPFSPKIKDLNWDMKIGYRNYIEEISEWFQFQLPTNKSKYYNINIHNLNIDSFLKENIESAINKIISRLSPAHTLLNKINWK